MRHIRMGTRGSALARWQADYVRGRLSTLTTPDRLSTIEVSSLGDQLTDVPLSHVEGTGFFTSTLERALLAREIDVAVHSLKDLPVQPTPGLIVAAIPSRAPVEDVLCGRDGVTLGQLRKGARIGTCSTRRVAQLHALRPDVEPVVLRGNVPTRVQHVTSGDLDAVVLARAGLVRLGLTSHITHVFTLDQMLPAPAQGALAIQCRAGDDEVLALVAPLDDMATRRAVETERAVLHGLGGGCSVPVGAFAHCVEGHLALLAGVFDMNPRRSIRIQMLGSTPATLASRAVARLLALGASRLLEEFGKGPRVATAAGDPS